MGGVQKTVQNLEFVKYDEANNVILIKGNVPGAKNSYVVVKNAVKAKNAAINPAALA
jgi:large subunit ribosomal protein L3